MSEKDGYNTIFPKVYSQYENIGEEAVKHDEGKIRIELFPGEALFAASEVLTISAKDEYEARNWEKGMAWSRVFGSLMRHAWAWFMGETYDKKTGKSHMAHVLCNAAFLMTYEVRKIGIDDRPKTNK